ncbi:DUF883 family protein [Roseateles sp. DB2]|uniref:DUF883 family protein n=1 Tax=Roseateles sp. DB2 TaxID=3453717 RepID=UPI003EEB8E5C
MNQTHDGAGGARAEGSTGGAHAATASGAPDMINRAADGAHVTIDRLAHQAAPVVQKLQEQLDEAGERLHERADQVGALGRQWREGLRSSVREHPLTTIVAALALGALIARLSR